MKLLPSSVLASLLASVVAASVAPALASPSDDAQPQCGDDKKDKSDDTKPKSPSGL